MVGHHRPPALLLVPAEGRHVLVAAEEQARLARAGLRGEVALPRDHMVGALVEPPRHRRCVSLAQRTDVPGVIMFEIDGLAEPVLQRACGRATCRTSHAGCKGAATRSSPGSATSPPRPAPARPACCSAATTTCPPFAGTRRSGARRWSPTTERTPPSSSAATPTAAACWPTGGASRGNLFSGDAPRCSATMSVIRDRERSGTREYFAYFADPYGFTRTVALYLWDVWLERRAARRQRQRRRGAHRPRRPVPVDARGDHRGHARAQRRDPDG